MTNQKSIYLKLLLLFIMLGYVLSANAQIDQQRAQDYFKEAQALCERDNGRLWGISICGPMVIFDKATKTIATSIPTSEGKWPQHLGLVNAPIQRGDTTWGAYIWNDLASKAPRDRRELFLHELFHIVQPKLGLGVPTNAPEHLDAKDGRFWLRLEWLALAKALSVTGAERLLAIRDALAFRNSRHQLYPAAKNDERGQEITEGLAAYTATVLVADSKKDAIQGALDLLNGAEATALTASFLRTFAYISGPAYGILLDESAPNWRKTVSANDDLAILLMKALSIRPFTDATESISRYSGMRIRISEEKREQERQERISQLQYSFIDGPNLAFPGGSHSFDTRGAVVIPDFGTVYFGPFRASGAWGKLEAENGVLVSSDGSSRRVAAPVRQDEVTYTGNGWTLTIAPGWEVREGAKSGNFELVRKE